MKNNKTKPVDEPIVTFISIIRNRGAFSVVTLKMQGEQIVTKTVTPEDLWPIAWEAFKMTAAKEYLP